METSDLMKIAERFKALKLTGMAQAISDVAALPVQLWPTLLTMLNKLVDTEVSLRDNARTERLIKAAKFRYKVLIEDITCSTARNLTKDQLEALADCGFVRRGENVTITGLTGGGKTYLGCALGNQACRVGLKTLYLSMNHFVDELKQARLSGTTKQLQNKLDKIDLIIFDDFGLQPIDADTRLALLTLLEDRYDRKSVVIISQLPFDKWYDYIGDPTFADAILDRLKNTSHHIRLEGESLRKRKF